MLFQGTFSLNLSVMPNLYKWQPRFLPAGQELPVTEQERRQPI